jgi:phosphoribosylaminoimidazole-succinocarboxamide synthase
MKFRGKQLPPAVTSTNIPFWPKRSGKVRDVYDTGESLLIVATDRISAYDSILGSGIPGKGRLLTALSLFWFDFLKDVTPSHLITADVVKADKRLMPFSEVAAGRSMLVKKARVLPIECVVRGYLSGSGWKGYRESGTVCGIKLPAGLKESDKLPEPIFTPATKAETGHDENISFEQAADIIGQTAAKTLRDRSIRIYRKAADYAATKGIIIADTKFEFGISDDRVILIDEVLTPDSSRFWPADDYAPGGSQKSYDKQYLRDYLDEIGWDHQPPAPALPDEVVTKTLEKYVEAYERLSGEKFGF